jgi:xanthine dehydrogenase accessory factor
MSDMSQYYKKLASAIESGNPIWQASIVETDGSTPARIGMKLAVPLQNDAFGNLGGGEMEYWVINAIRREQPKSIVKWSFNLDEQGKPLSESDIQTQMLCGGKAEVLVEPLFAPHPLYIIGAGHCGRALAELAVKVDFQVTVIDNRQDLLQVDAFPAESRLIYNDYNDLEQAIAFNENAFIVIMTYGHVHDKQVLEYCLSKPYRYLGMIGSKNKVNETMTKVKANGFSDADIAKVHAPIGLPIHSHTPYEIAISILAELISIKNQS